MTPGRSRSAANAIDFALTPIPEASANVDSLGVVRTEQREGVALDRIGDQHAVTVAAAQRGKE
jgi:hypothetical protein